VITPRRPGGPALHPPDAVPPPSALRSRLPFRS
jgi:hypothetical protein